MMGLIKREDAIKGKIAQTLNANAEFMMERCCNEDEIRIYNIGFAEGWNAHIERCKDIPSVEPTIEIDAHQLAKLLREGWTIHSEPKQGEWIPCSERLPTLNEDGVSDMVLLCWSDGQMTVGAYQGNRTFCGQAWPVAKDCRVTVVAWQPLPKPWEGADDDIDNV